MEETSNLKMISDKSLSCLDNLKLTNPTLIIEMGYLFILFGNLGDQSKAYFIDIKSTSREL